jgi:aminoglycoside 3-N-acetyltransferase
MIPLEKLVEQLETLGLPGKRPVMLHASLRRVGPVGGGSAGVLDAIFQAMGGDGTLIMPLGADPTRPFDAATTPADPDIGAAAELFRLRAGTRVNDHAASRWAASGPLADELLEPMPLHDYHGPGSVLARFVSLEGRILRLGADMDTMTLTHLAEYLAEVPDKRRVRLCYLRADIGEQWIESLDDSGGISNWEDEEDDDYFPRILADYLATGTKSVGPVGGCAAELLPGPEYLAFAVKWMERHFA